MSSASSTFQTAVLLILILLLVANSVLIFGCRCGQDEDAVYYFYWRDRYRRR